MRYSYTSLIAVMLVVIAVAIAGCSSSSPAASPSGGAQTTAAPAGTSFGSSSGGSGSAVTGASLFGGLNYNWVEYKMTTGSGDQSMTIYTKYDKTTGKCTMRFEGAAAANMPASMQNIDCSSKGSSTTTQSNPNTVPSDAQVTCSPLTEKVVVPAGPFDATKCTVTSQGHTSTTWIVKDKFMVKMESSSDAGAVSMVLNAYG
jgi:ABC-type oligopeptide transport system substrate-binding subunit